MFKLDPEPTFKCELTIVGQAREQKLNLVYRHMTRDRYAEMIDRVVKGEVTAAQAVCEIVESWDADKPIAVDVVETATQNFPNLDWSILNGYVEALAVARKGN